MDLLEIEVLAVIKTCDDCGFIHMNHPPYSPDLAPSDYYLFRNLKNMCGRRFSSNEELQDDLRTKIKNFI